MNAAAAQPTTRAERLRVIAELETRSLAAAATFHEKLMGVMRQRVDAAEKAQAAVNGQARGLLKRSESVTGLATDWRRRQRQLNATLNLLQSIDVWSANVHEDLGHVHELLQYCAENA